MSVNFLHSSINKHVEGDKRETNEEFIIHGSKGFSAKYYHKDSKQDIKIVVVQKDAKYIVKVKVGDKVDEKTLATKAEVIKELGKHKEAKFIVDYLSKAKTLSRSGSRKGSKRGSKHRGGSRKGSKKSSKKNSKKGSKKH